MKKLLSILAALGLTATAASSVVACGSASKPAKNVTPTPKPVPTPTPTQDGVVFSSDAAIYNGGTKGFIYDIEKVMGKVIVSKDTIKVTSKDLLTSQFNYSLSKDNKKLIVTIPEEISEGAHTFEVSFKTSDGNKWTDPISLTAYKDQPTDTKVIWDNSKVNLTNDGNSESVTYKLKEAGKDIDVNDGPQLDEQGTSLPITAEDLSWNKNTKELTVKLDNDIQPNENYVIALIFNETNGYTGVIHTSLQTEKVVQAKPSADIFENSEAIYDSNINGFAYNIKGNISDDIELDNSSMKISSDNLNAGQYSAKLSDNKEQLVITINKEIPGGNHLFNISFKLKNEKDEWTSSASLTAVKDQATDTNIVWDNSSVDLGNKADSTVATFKLQSAGSDIDLTKGPKINTEGTDPSITEKDIKWDASTKTLEVTLEKGVKSGHQLAIALVFSLTNGYEGNIYSFLHVEKQAPVEPGQVTFADTEAVYDSTIKGFAYDIENVPSDVTIDDKSSVKLTTGDSSDMFSYYVTTDKRNGEKQLVIYTPNEIYGGVHTFEVSFKSKDSKSGWTDATTLTAVKNTATDAQISWEKSKQTFANNGDIATVTYKATNIGSDIDVNKGPVIDQEGTDLAITNDDIKWDSSAKTLTVTLNKEITGNHAFVIALEFDLTNGYKGQVHTFLHAIKKDAFTSEKTLNWNTVSQDLKDTDQASFSLVNKPKDINLSAQPIVTAEDKNLNGKFDTVWNNNSLVINIDPSSDLTKGTYKFDVQFAIDNGYENEGSVTSVLSVVKTYADAYQGMIDIPNHGSQSAPLNIDENIINTPISIKGTRVDTSKDGYVIKAYDSNNKEVDITNKYSTDINKDGKLDVSFNDGTFVQGSYSIKLAFKLTGGLTWYNNDPEETTIDVIKANPSKSELGGPIKTSGPNANNNPDKMVGLNGDSTTIWYDKTISWKLSNYGSLVGLQDGNLCDGYKGKNIDWTDLTPEDIKNADDTSANDAKKTRIPGINGQYFWTFDHTTGMLYFHRVLTKWEYDNFGGSAGQWWAWNGRYHVNVALPVKGFPGKTISVTVIS